MGRFPMGGLALFGAVLMVAGGLGLAIPVFSTHETRDVLKVGELKIQTTETRWYVVPPIAAGGVLVPGAVLLGLGYLGLTRFGGHPETFTGGVSDAKIPTTVFA